MSVTEGTSTDLADRLSKLGEALPESHRPVPHQVPNLVSGMLYWLETGSLEPPVYKSPQSPVLAPEAARIAELEAALAAAQAAAAPPVQVTPAVPVPEAPAPEPDADDTSPQSPATPPSAEPVPVPTPGQAQSPAPSTTDIPSSPAS